MGLLKPQRGYRLDSLTTKKGDLVNIYPLFAFPLKQAKNKEKP